MPVLFRVVAAVLGVIYTGYGLLAFVFAGVRVGGGGDLMNIELAIREWARRDAAVAERLRRLDNRRMDYMRRLFKEFCPDPDEIEVRCLLVLSLWVGTELIPAEHEGRSRAEVMKRALRWVET
jgi:hypothetical protein